MATPTSDGVVSGVSLFGTNNIDSLLSEQKWGGSTGTSVSLTYSFGGSNSWYVTDYQGDYPWSGFEALSSTQQNATVNALAAWSDVANIQFTQVTDSESVAGDLRFAKSSVPSTAVGFYPAASPEAGDIWFSDSSDYNTDVKGTYGYFTFLHEIGHALGLKHPHETDFGGAADSSIDTTAYSVMSYKSYVGQPVDAGLAQSFFPTTLMLNDIAAIQYLYGANMDTRSDDTVYSWETGQQLLETIWDGGGTDTIDWSNQSSAATINLGAGQWSELGPTYWNGVEDVSQTLAIAYNVTIENATGGTGDDTITGNDVSNNLQGGDGNDALYGLGGNDSLDGWNGDDSLDGGTGDDSLLGYYGNDSLQGGDGNDALYGEADNDSLDGWNGDDSLYGGSGDDSLLGYYGNDYLSGNDGNDFLNGEADNDTLVGSFGSDTLTGGAGADQFTFYSAIEGVDTITDFLWEEGDTLVVSASGFGGGLAIGDLAWEQFTIGSTAVDESDRFIYDYYTGELFFDTDGIGTLEQVQFATLSTNLSLISSDISVIA